MCTCIRIGGAAAPFAKTGGPRASQANVLSVPFVQTYRFVDAAIGSTITLMQ